MMELVRLTVQNMGLERGDITVALWLGAGLIVGLVLAFGSIAAIAIEWLRHEQSYLL